MLANRSRRTSHHSRICGAILVAALLVVPFLVRATQPFDQGTSSPIRLNRGFDAPEAKCQVAPPLDAPLLRSVVMEKPEAAGPMHALPSVDEPIADSLHHSSPDPLRGPPLPLLA